MRIGTHTIGYGQPTFVIAEMCSNILSHMNITSDDLELCIRDVALSGAQAAKIQLFRHTHFPESECEQKKRVEFPRDWFQHFVELCHEYGLVAGASVFDEEAVHLCEDTGADFLKLATREFGNDALQSMCDLSPLPVLQSFDTTKYIMPPVPPRNRIYLSCMPEYPAITPRIPPTMDLKHDWGWSSHSPDWLDVCLAVSRGACAIEKHIKFHNDDPEAGWSLMPQDFKRMVEDIRRVEQMR